FMCYVGGDRQPSQYTAGVENGMWPNSIGATNYTGRLFRVDATFPPGTQATPLTHNGTFNNSAPHADSRAMVFDSNGNLLEADDGGIYRRVSPSSDGDWFGLNGNLQ